MASAGAIAVFVVAAVWLMRTDDDTAYIASKGTPAVQVLLRTGDKTAIWDGKSPLHPGDALALRVACQGFARVAVVTPSAATEGLTRLTRGPCPASGASLPFSLVVDDAPGNERIAVVFSAQELEDRDLYDAMTREPRTKDVWVIKLTFQKVEGRRP
jgi:hypothetical protein